MESSKKQIEKLKAFARENEIAARLLVRRDLELSEANKKLQELDTIKSEFVSIVAHQLRTPLSAIKWTLKMIIDGDLGSLNEEQVNFLSKGYESNEHLIRLINDMLNVSRIDAGKSQYFFYMTRIEDILNGAIKYAQDVARRKNIEITYKKSSTELSLAYIDPEKIRLSLQNVFDNAIQYTPPRGKIEIIAKKGQNVIEISIKDSGIGIPKDQQKNIFTKFFRGTNALKMQTEGSGLGLFIAKNIIEKHSGKIWFQSTENKGTTFFISIPLSKITHN